MREIIYSIDTSLDGYIARSDNQFDFLDYHGDHMKAFSISLHQYDVVLMGRKTYEIGVEAGVVNPALPFRQIVVSTKLKSTIDKRIEIISTDTMPYIRKLRESPGKNIMVSGGSRLAFSLLQEKLLDAMEVRIHPVVIGAGIPAFLNSHTDLRLVLRSSQIHSSGVIFHSYAIKY
jgi:dihydrofolate reductase